LVKYLVRGKREKPAIICRFAFIAKEVAISPQTLPTKAATLSFLIHFDGKGRQTCLSSSFFDSKNGH
jgi:hypothetical protein